MPLHLTEAYRDLFIETLRASGFQAVRADGLRPGDEIHGDCDRTLDGFRVPATVTYCGDSPHGPIIDLELDGQERVQVPTTAVYAVKRGRSTPSFPNEPYRSRFTPAPSADRDRYPHTCLRCGSPAYIGGMGNVDCSNGGCA